MSKIHTALLEAMKEIAQKGIAKTLRASLGGATVNYRGIEAAMNEMSPILIQCGITVTPEYSDLSILERAKAEGKATRFATIKGRFTFAAEDGSNVVCTTYGEAMDSGDKATIKAQSVAFRTALFQQFVVPTMAMDTEDGDGDPDAPSLREQGAIRVKEAQTESDLKAISKELVAQFNKARDMEGYQAFVKQVQARGAEIKGAGNA